MTAAPLPVTLYANVQPIAVTPPGGTDAPASGTVETWTVATPNTFPAASSKANPPTQFHIVDPALPSEIIAVTDVSTTSPTWTVTRGAEGTTPVAHSSGFTVNLVVSAGDLTGFLQQNAVTDGIVSGATDWVNVKSPQYGAFGDGSADDTDAIQDALDALSAAGGGVLYIPRGSYNVSSTLTWNSGNALRVVGDSQVTSELLMNSATAPFHCLDIQNANAVTVENIDIVNTVSPNLPSDDYVGLAFTACSRVRLQNVRTASTATRMNIAVSLTNVGVSSIIACDLRAYVNAVYMTGTPTPTGGTGCAVLDLIATGMFTNEITFVLTGTTVNPGNIYVNDSVATVHITNCETNGGNSGLVLTGGTGANPSFVFVHDFEVNNCHGHAIVLDTGAEFWANQLWCSNNPKFVPTSEAAYNGVYVGPSFDGWVVIDNSTFQEFSGNGMYIDGGNSYWISNTSFSGCGGYALNSYDDIHVAGGVDNVTIHGCHFDVEPFAGMKQPRSGVFIGTAVNNYDVSGNIFASSGYGTASCIDLNNPPQPMGFTNNLHGFDYKPAASTKPLTQIDTTDTIVAQLAIDPYDLLSGAMFRFSIFGQYSNGAASKTNTINFRAGKAGDTSPAPIATVTATSDSATGNPASILIDGEVQLVSPGLSGSGNCWVRVTQSSPGYSTAVEFFPQEVSGWNTTLPAWLSLSFQSGDPANKLTVTMATLEKVV